MAQPTISHCPFVGVWLTDDNQVIGIDDGECSAFTNFQSKPETRTCSGTIKGYPEIYTGKLTKNLRTIKWSGGEVWTREDPKMDTKFGNKMGHKTKVGTRSKSTSSQCSTRHHKRSRSLSNITTLEPGDLNDILAHHKNQRTAATSQHRERTQRYHKTKAVDGPISRKRRVQVTTSIKVVPKWEHTTNLQKQTLPGRNTRYVSVVKHEQPHEMDRSTDMSILHMDMPAQQPGIWDALQMQLRAMHGMHEVAVGRSTGPFVRISLKGTAEALYEAQKRLGRTLGLDLVNLAPPAKQHRPIGHNN